MMVNSVGGFMAWGVSVFQNKYFVSILYILCVSFVFFIWVWTADSQNVSFNGDPRSKVSELISGTASRPFVQRILIPICTQTVYNVISDSAKASLVQQILHLPKIQKEIHRLGWEEDYILQYFIALSFSLLFLLIFPFTIRSIIRFFYQTDEWIINLFGIFLVLGLPIFFHTGTRYIYDFPALSLFTLAFYLMLKRKWLWYYIIFFVGLMNKETIILLTILFAFIYYRRTSTLSYWINLILQCSLFVLVRGTISWIFRDNPGQNFEFHFYGNLRIIADNWTLHNIVIGGIVLFFIFYQYRFKPAILQKAFFVGLLLIVLTLFFGYIHEARDYYEIYPWTAFLILHTIFFSLFQLPFTEKYVKVYVR
jgi:hypothetical protein